MESSNAFQLIQTESGEYPSAAHLDKFLGEQAPEVAFLDIRLEPRHRSGQVLRRASTVSWAPVRLHACADASTVAAAPTTPAFSRSIAGTMGVAEAN
jgi:hypothetical protein